MLNKTHSPSHHLLFRFKGSEIWLMSPCRQLISKEPLVKWDSSNWQWPLYNQCLLICCRIIIRVSFTFIDSSPFFYNRLSSGITLKCKLIFLRFHSFIMCIIYFMLFLTSLKAYLVNVALLWFWKEIVIFKITRQTQHSKQQFIVHFLHN